MYLPITLRPSLFFFLSLVFSFFKYICVYVCVCVFVCVCVYIYTSLSFLSLSLSVCVCVVIATWSNTQSFPIYSLYIIIHILKFKHCVITNRYSLSVACERISNHTVYLISSGAQYQRNRLRWRISGNGCFQWGVQSLGRLWYFGLYHVRVWSLRIVMVSVILLCYWLFDYDVITAAIRYSKSS